MSDAGDQDRVTRAYDRFARIYDLYDAPMDRLGVRRRRERVLGKARGDVLEVGIGTGRNLDLYSPGIHLTGLDASPGMLARARARARARALIQRLLGPAVNRRTEANVNAAGLEIVELRQAGVWREIVARPRG